MEEKILFWIEELEKVIHGKYVPPICCEIDPSNNCMLDCSFCFYRKVLPENRGNMDMRLYRRLLNSLLKQGVKAITLTGGGEPLMNPNFQEMFDLATDLGFEVGLVTNGVLLDKVERVEKFKFIRVSLDAGCDETYFRIKGKPLFHTVIKNVATALMKQPTVGLSYVVCEENCYEVEKASCLSKDLGAAYIQFKPMLTANEGFDLRSLNLTSNNKVIITERYRAGDLLPCIIAHLVGVVEFDGKVSFCCQHRGAEEMVVGNLEREDFETSWRRRLSFIGKVDPRKCPRCRYMSYAVEYKKFLDSGSLMVAHRNFL